MKDWLDINLKKSAKFCKFFLLFLTLSCGNSPNKEKPDIKLLLEANNLANQGNCQLAISKLTNINEKEIIGKKESLIMANIYRICRKSEDSHLYYDAIIANSENDKKLLVEAMEGKSLLYIEDANIFQAQLMLKKILTYDATRWKSLNSLGILLDQEGKTEEALDYYNLAKKLSNGNHAVLNNISLSLAKLKLYEEALLTIDEAIKNVDSEKMKEKLQTNRELIISLSKNKIKK